MTDLIELISKTYGLVGLLILAPMASTFYLWKHVVDLQAKLVKSAEEHTETIKILHQARILDVERVNGLIMEVQEKRVSDAQVVVAKLITTISDQTAMNSETNQALERVGDFLAISQTKAIPQHTGIDEDRK